MRPRIKQLAKRALARVGLKVSRYHNEAEGFHNRHRREAEQVLAVVEAKNGKSDPRWIARSTEYATDVLGWPGYAPWLWAYSAISGSFKEGWIPDNYYGAVVLDRVKGVHGRLSGLKTVARRMFGDSALFPDIAYRVNGVYFSAGCRIDAAELKAILFRDGPQVIFKNDRSGRGAGIRFFSRETFGPELLDGLPDGVFQTKIEQHPELAEFAYAAVATLRITTTIDEGSEYQVRSAYLRLGSGVDTHVRAPPRVRIAVDTETGALAEEGFTATWETIDRHPDSQVRFKGRTVPVYRDCLQSVLDLHRCMPTVQCIGWDLTVNSADQVQVMEWNGYHNDIKFSEATQGPCFVGLNWENLWRNGKRLRLEPGHVDDGSRINSGELG